MERHDLWEEHLFFRQTKKEGKRKINGDVVTLSLSPLIKEYR